MGLSQKDSPLIWKPMISLVVLCSFVLCQAELNHQNMHPLFHRQNLYKLSALDKKNVYDDDSDYPIFEEIKEDPYGIVKGIVNDIFNREGVIEPSIGLNKRVPYKASKKQDPYTFGLGKRDPYTFGLGKRNPYAFGLGKRTPYAFGLGKRSPYAFGLGKREPYGFGLGKRNE